MGQCGYFTTALIGNKEVLAHFVLDDEDLLIEVKIGRRFKFKLSFEDIEELHELIQFVIDLNKKRRWKYYGEEKKEEGGTTE